MTHSTPSLTICIVTNRVDERCIRALESSQVAESILILDHHSGADWSTLATMYRFEVRELPAGPITDFAAVRNLALAVTKTEWILFLDSDEYIPPDQLQTLHTVLTESAADAYTVTRIDHFLGQAVRHGEGSVRLIRLLRTARAHFVGAVHEQATTTGTTSHSGIELHHTSHESVAAFVTKVSWYARMAAAECRVGFWSNMLQLVFYPPGKFIWNFICKSGWRDGWRGLVYAVLMSLHSVCVRVYRYEQANKQV
jgi:glycosyltransferase involved in cell wall biosynthesis